MSEHKNAEAPAFPWEQSPWNQNNLGLTKREYFAGLAMAAIIGRQAGARDNILVAQVATQYADALLAELEK